MSSISSPLPPELWLHILSYLPKDTLKRLMTVSSLFFAKAMDAKYETLNIYPSHSIGPSNAFSYFVRLMDHLTTSRTQIAPRARHIMTEGDLLEKLVPPPEPGKLRRLSSLMSRKTEPVLTPELIKSSFSGCTNVERLDITFNGWRPGMPIVWDPPDSIYTLPSLVDNLLHSLCHSFWQNLRELRLTLDNRHKVRHVLKSPSLHFPALEVLHLRLYRNAMFQSSPWDQEFSDFVGQFSETLRALNIRLSGPGPVPLDILLGSSDVNFPLLRTFGLKCQSSYSSEQGLQYLNAFFLRAPSLKHFHILGACFQRHEHLQNDVIILPSGTSLSSFGTSEEMWRTHVSHLYPVLSAFPPRNLAIQLDLHNPGRQTLFRQSIDQRHFGMTSRVRELKLQMVDVNLNSVISAVADLFTDLHTLVIECESVLVPRPGGHHGSYDSTRYLDDEAIQRVEHWTKDKLKYPEHSLTSLDIVQRALGSTADNDHRISICSCPEVRLWSLMRIFGTHFPRLEWFGGGMDVLPSVKFGSQGILGLNRMDERDVCEDCRGRDAPQLLRSRKGMPRIRW